MFWLFPGFSFENVKKEREKEMNNEKRLVTAIANQKKRESEREKNIYSL